MCLINIYNLHDSCLRSIFHFDGSSFHRFFFALQIPDGKLTTGCSGFFGPAGGPGEEVSDVGATWEGTEPHWKCHTVTLRNFLRRLEPSLTLGVPLRTSLLHVAQLKATWEIFYPSALQRTPLQLTTSPWISLHFLDPT